MKKFFLVLTVLLLVALGAFFYKTGATVSKISTNANILGSITKNLPLVGAKEKTLKGEEEGRINVVVLGMRGKGMEGGGLLADTIMVVSYAPQSNKAAIVSIPRDLYIAERSERINKIYHDGETRQSGGGLEAMKEILQEVTGQPMHYAVALNFAGFRQVVDALGGVEVELEEEFVEPKQFKEERVCDGHNGGVFVVPSGNYQEKIDHRGKVVARYPLCYNKTNECGGVFRVPAGKSVLDGERALCYVRARVTSSDFDRARRQQEILAALQKKALSIGTLTDFGKINALLDALGNNVSTDMQIWEMQRFFELYKQKGFPQVVTQKVLDNSPEGLLYTPEGAGENGSAYILKPRGDNYEQIRKLFAELLNESTPDSDSEK